MADPSEPAPIPPHPVELEEDDDVFPDEHPSEQALANALAKLSMSDQEKILFDLHGISPTYDEDPETIDRKLQELEQTIQNMPSKTAYERALELNPDFVNNREFRIMFLRCQRFQLPQAAEVLVEHFEMKKELFGDGEVLVRDLRISDLNQAEKQIVYSGMFQMLPNPDAAGRPVMVLAGDRVLHCNLPMRQLQRVFFFLRMLGTGDVMAQINGVIWLMYCGNEPAEELACLREMLGERCESVPQAITGGHVCSTNPNLRHCLADYQMEQPSDYYRFRIRHHIGTHDVISFELQTFGIRAQEGPMQLDGTWSTKYHTEFLKQLELLEPSEDPTLEAPAVAAPPKVEPQRFDVLLGKTKRSLDHTGNRRLGILCEMHYKVYTEANKFKKTEIANRIVSIIHESGGRFLSWEKEEWVVAEDLVARNKVSHTFRFLRAKIVKAAPPASASANVSTNATKSPSPNLVSDATVDTDEASCSDGSSHDEAGKSSRNPATKKAPSEIDPDGGRSGSDNKKVRRREDA